VKTFLRQIFDQLEQGNGKPLGWTLGVLALAVFAVIGLVNGCSEDLDTGEVVQGSEAASEESRTWSQGTVSEDCYGMRTKDAMDGAVTFLTLGETEDYNLWVALHLDESIPLSRGDRVEIVGSYGHLDAIRFPGQEDVFYTYYKWIDR